MKLFSYVIVILTIGFIVGIIIVENQPLNRYDFVSKHEHDKTISIITPNVNCNCIDQSNIVGDALQPSKLIYGDNNFLIGKVFRIFVIMILSLPFSTFIMLHIIIFYAFIATLFFG